MPGCGAARDVRPGRAADVAIAGTSAPDTDILLAGPSGIVCPFADGRAGIADVHLRTGQKTTRSPKAARLKGKLPIRRAASRLGRSVSFKCRSSNLGEGDRAGRYVYKVRMGKMEMMSHCERKGLITETADVTASCWPSRALAKGVVDDISAMVSRLFGVAP